MKTIWLTLSGLTMAACKTTATDNTILEPSRDQRIDSLAAATCSRYQACNGYGTGTGQTYATEASCRQDYSSKAASAWPVAKCDSGRINNTNYNICEESAKQVACTGDAWDGLVAMGKCGSDKVCIDAPH